MPPPLPPEVRNAIIEDLREGRLSFEEIAAKRLGDGGKKPTVSRIAKKEGYSRKGKGRPPKKGYQPKVTIPKPESIAEIDFSTFGPEERLLLIDQALSELKAILPKSRYPAGIMQWTAALERLLDQRRKETGTEGDGTESDDYLEAVRATAKDDWKDEVGALQVEAPEPEAAKGDELVDAG